jgi:ankyrin repeat protein
MQDETLVKDYIQRMTPEEIGQQDVGSFTALYLAKGHEGIVRALPSKMRPQDLGLINCYSFTVLDEAIMSWSVSMIELLLQRMLPEDINRQNLSGWTALHLAATHGREGAAKALLKKMTLHAVWARTTEPQRRTALHMAANNNYYDTVQRLTDVGNESQLAIRDERGQSALHIAAEQGHSDVVRTLLDKMSPDDVWNSDQIGETALHKAAANSHKEIVRLLIGKATDVDDLTQRNNMEFSAQDLAAARQDRRIVKLLEDNQNRMMNSA